MNETYLKFYSEDKGLIHESELPENFDFKYLRHKEDGYYELLKNHYVGKVDKRNSLITKTRRFVYKSRSCERFNEWWYYSIY